MLIISKSVQKLDLRETHMHFVMRHPVSEDDQQTECRHQTTMRLRQVVSSNHNMANKIEIIQWQWSRIKRNITWQ